MITAVFRCVKYSEIFYSEKSTTSISESQKFQRYMAIKTCECIYLPSARSLTNMHPQTEHWKQDHFLRIYIH
jgi:hypothetical protein